MRKARNLERDEYSVGLVVHLASTNLYQNGQREPLTISKMRRWMARLSDTDRDSWLSRAVSLISPPLIPTRSRLMPLHQLDTCLTGLKQQGISVTQGGAGDSGSIFEVMGFMLTAEQIVELHQQGQMDANGIKAFAKSIKQDL